MVPMRDGVRLATDVYAPSTGRRVPTVLARLPYDKSGRFSFMPQIAQLFNERGYAFVAQDVRGKARSEGELEPFVHEASDGYDTIEWLVGRSWSDGTVGMFGDSYYGFTQWAAAVAGHAALRAIVPRITTTELGTDWMYHQGVFCLYCMAEWAATTWVNERLYEAAPDFSVRPLSELVPALHAGRRSPSLDAWAARTAGDPSWTEGVFGTADPLDRVRIPVLHSGGWWDVFQRGQIRDFMRLHRDRAPDQHLLMASTDHFDDPLVQDGESVEDIMEDDAALARFLPGYVAPALEFFDRHLLGLAGPPIPTVRWHLANEGWRESADWPPPEAQERKLHLADAERALDGPEGGALAGGPESGPSRVRWVHDPSDLVPDLVRDCWRPLLDLPDERRIEAREDVLTFTGEPARSPLDLAGPATLTATVRSRPGPMHLAAKLVDVYPSGRARRILQGIARVGDAAADRPVLVDLGHTGYRLRTGHRLRLEVACSDFPRYLPDMGDERDPWSATEGTVREQELVVGQGAGSSLTLTVLSG